VKNQSEIARRSYKKPASKLQKKISASWRIGGLAAYETGSHGCIRRRIGATAKSKAIINAAKTLKENLYRRLGA
jgi:hypothetical protein